MDRDNDGRIDKHELKAFISKSGLRPERFDTTFAKVGPATTNLAKTLSTCNCVQILSKDTDSGRALHLRCNQETSCKHIGQPEPPTMQLYSQTRANHSVQSEEVPFVETKEFMEVFLEVFDSQCSICVNLVLQDEGETSFLGL